MIIKTRNDGEFMNLKGAIFDMDGTLIDSMPIWYGIGTEFLKQKGITPRKDLNEKIKAMSMLESAEYLIEEYHLDESAEKIIEHLNELLHRHYSETIPLKPGVERFLVKLKENKTKMCVATATDIHLTEAALKRLGIINYFEGIITCGQAGMGKDKPEFFHEAFKLINTPISETVIFEDALYAIKSAKAAGFLVAGIYDESALDDTKEIRSLADFYLNSFDEWEMNGH